MKYELLFIDFKPAHVVNALQNTKCNMNTGKLVCIVYLLTEGADEQVNTGYP